MLTSDSITSVTLTSAGAAATANVAGSPYAIVPSAAVGSGLGNYTIHYANGSLTVNPAPLTVTAVVSPTDIGHGDTVPTPTFTYSGFVNGDTAAAVVSGTPGSYGLPTNSSPAGIYTITPTTIGLSAANYDFHTVVSATLNIHPVVTDILVEWGTGTKSMSILNLSRDLPFADITGFQVKFSDVVNITGTGLSLTSTAGGPTYAPNLVSSGQSTNDASWNLPTAIGIDRLMLALDQAAHHRLVPHLVRHEQPCVQRPAGRLQRRRRGQRRGHDRRQQRDRPALRRLGGPQRHRHGGLQRRAVRTEQDRHRAAPLLGLRPAAAPRISSRIDISIN